MKWSQEEIDSALVLLKTGKTYKEVSLLIGRSEGSVRNKMNEFNERSSLYKVSNDIDVNCLQCGSTFIDLKVRGRKFCSRSCGVIFNNKKKKKKQSDCLNCGKETNRSGNKYCSNSCQLSYNRKEVFEKIENGDITLYEANYKKYLIHKHGEKCML